MKMPEKQSTDNGLYEYEDNPYYPDGIDNNGVEEFNAPPEDDFSEYLWMENEEEFDKEVLQRLEEEALMEQCIEAMIDDEITERVRENTTQESSNEVANMISNLKLECSVDVKCSILNPLAAEFVPGGGSLTSDSTATNGSS